jgi:hypothetical protein
MTKNYHGSNEITTSGHTGSHNQIFEFLKKKLENSSDFLKIPQISLKFLKLLNLLQGQSYKAWLEA